MKYTISVKQHHLDKGERGVAERCAIALACEEQKLPSFLYVGAKLVGGRIYFRDRSSVRLPPEAGLLMRFFDDGRDVAPLDFDIDLPEPNATSQV